MIDSVHSGPVKRKFIFLFLHLVTQRDVQRFGSETFSQRGYDVNLVSCWNALYTKNSDTFEIGDFRNAPGVIAPQSREELEQFLDTLTATDLILMTVHLSVETLWIFQALDKRGLRYSCLSLGPIPETFYCQLGNFLDVFKCISIKFHNAYSFVYRLAARIKLIWEIGLPYMRLKAPLFFIRCGLFNPALSFPAPFLWRSHVIDVEGFDMGWSRLMETQNIEVPESPYAVFLDEALSHHPDWALGGGRPDNIDGIYNDLRHTFDALENDLELPIVIALHPKAVYTEAEIKTLFGGRQVFKNITPALVRRADLVLGHASTSFSYAVIYRKPVMFLTNSDIRNSRDGILVDIRASWLGQQPINMSLFDGQCRISMHMPSVNESAYERYIHNFICSRNANIGPIWAVVAERFEKISKSAPHN